MKRILLAITAGTAVIWFAAFAGDVSINVGEPGFFGRIDIGDAPSPQLVYRQPIVIERVRDGGHQPIYLHVPPGHERNWRKHCREYDACGQPVYFVRDSWYNGTYVPHVRDHGRDHAEHRDERHDDRHDEHRDGHHND